MESTIDSEDAKIIDGLPISASQVKRLEREWADLQEKLDTSRKKNLKYIYCTLQIKRLTKHPLESDQAKVKADNTKIAEYQEAIKKKEKQILAIRLYL